MPTIFFSYSHDDEALRDQLEKHLASLRHEGAIDSWHDRRILPGENVDAAIDSRISTSDVILLLVSASFLNSQYCYSIEMRKALERHAKGECKVVPIILRACDWTHTPLGKLMAAPCDGKPITSWTNLDEAFADVARQIRLLVQEIARENEGASRSRQGARQTSLQAPVPPSLDTARSSNLRMRKDFTDFEKDQFAHEGFDYLQRFFRNSLAELQARNPGVQGSLRRVSDTRFTASVYRDGKTVSECAISIGEGFGRNCITYSGSLAGNGYNEMLSVGVDDQQIQFKSLMGISMRGRADKLSYEGAAELLWAGLVERLQR